MSVSPQLRGNLGVRVNAMDLSLVSSNVGSMVPCAFLVVRPRGSEMGKGRSIAERYARHLSYFAQYFKFCTAIESQNDGPIRSSSIPSTSKASATSKHFIHKGVRPRTRAAGQLKTRHGFCPGRHAPTPRPRSCSLQPVPLSRWALFAASNAVMVPQRAGTRILHRAQTLAPVGLVAVQLGPATLQMVLRCSWSCHHCGLPSGRVDKYAQLFTRYKASVMTPRTAFLFGAGA